MEQEKNTQQEEHEQHHTDSWNWLILLIIVAFINSSVNFIKSANISEI